MHDPEGQSARETSTVLCRILQVRGCFWAVKVSCSESFEVRNRTAFKTVSEELRPCFVEQTPLSNLILGHCIGWPVRTGQSRAVTVHSQEENKEATS